MKNFILLTTFLSFSALFLQGQSTGQPTHGKMSSAKIGFLTKHLQLTPDEAKQFWPLYAAYEKEKTANNKERKLAGYTAKLYKEEMNDKEAAEFLEKMNVLQQRHLDVKKKYQAEFLQVLPAKKVFRLMNAEKMFHQQQQLMRKEKGESHLSRNESEPRKRD